MSILGVIHEWSSRPFCYGVSDCCRFAGAIVEEVTGKNPMDAFDYHDERTAKRVIARYGGLEQAVTATLGPPVSPETAEDGDVLMVESEQGPAVATCYRRRAVVLTPNGPTDWPLEWATRCWKVSCRKS